MSPTNTHNAQSNQQNAQSKNPQDAQGKNQQSATSNQQQDNKSAPASERSGNQSRTEQTGIANNLSDKNPRERVNNEDASDKENASGNRSGNTGANTGTK